MNENLNFQIDNNAMFELIYGQAGSLQKALLELVMNAIDAKATKVEVELPPEGDRFIVSDDGVGFRNRDEIENYFARIGFDHSELAEQRRYGRFGLGRLQALCFASTVWETNHFSLAVDIKRHGLKIDMTEHGSAQWRGCRIQGTFYDRQDNLELNATLRELTEMTAYAEIPVRINGQCVNKIPSECKWTFEDDDAYYSVRNNSSTLTIYNLGVKVCSLPASRYGVGGIVVSKQPLELNIARNEVLMSRCERFKRVIKVLRSYAVTESTAKPQRLNDARRESLLQQFIAGNVEFGEIKDLKLIPTMKSRVSLSDLTYSSWTIAPRLGDSIAEYLHRSRQYKVLDPRILEWLSVGNGAALATELNATAPDDLNAGIAFIRGYTDFKDASRGLSDSYSAIPRGDLTPEQKALLSALESASYFCRRAIHRVTGEWRNERRIEAGVSDSALAWTDGRQAIWFNLKELDRAMKGDDSLAALLPILLHEYCHAEADNEAHSHDLEFYELFHEASCVLANASANSTMVRHLNGALKRTVKRIPVWIQRAASKGVLNDEIPLHFDEQDEAAA